MDITIVYKIMELAGLVIGLFYLYFEYKADSKVWICGIIMPAISMTLYFSKGLYADFGINVYYLLAAVYGLVVWRRPKGKREVRICHIPPLRMVVSLGVFVALWGAIYWILARFTDSNVPCADSFTTALSIIGLWMLARKYVEQWMAWIVVDVVCVALYFYKGLYFYSVLYAIYTGVAVAGYFKWIRLMRTEKTDRP